METRKKNVHWNWELRKKRQTQTNGRRRSKFYFATSLARHCLYLEKVEWFVVFQIQTVSMLSSAAQTKRRSSILLLVLVLFSSLPLWCVNFRLVLSLVLLSLRVAFFVFWIWFDLSLLYTSFIVVFSSMVVSINKPNSNTVEESRLTITCTVALHAFM